MKNNINIYKIKTGYKIIYAEKYKFRFFFKYSVRNKLIAAIFLLPTKDNVINKNKKIYKGDVSSRRSYFTNLKKNILFSISMK